MEIVYILVALAAALLAYFLFFKKGEPAQLPDKTAKPLPKPKPEAREKAPKKAEAPPPSAEARKKEAAKGKEAAAEAPPEQEVEEAPEEAAGRVHRFAPPDVQSMRRGLARSRQEEGIFGKLRSLFTGRREIDEDIAADIEEILLTSDVGVATTQAILERIRDGLRKGELSDSAKVWDALREEAKRIVSVEGRAGGLYLAGKPTVVLMVGVNGAGKTTTIGKLATKLKAEGKTCVLAAGDTFRAAAVEQLRVWGERVGCAVVHGKDRADPSSVLFDAVKKAQDNGADVVLADTAGRLHTKTNLMEEMKKVVRSVEKALPGAPHETLLVIDATNGQNALAQAREFKDALNLTGIVLTKLDGTAKGGMVLGICDSLKIPIRFVGLGERPDDLHDFSPDEFVEALLGKEAEASAA